METVVTVLMILVCFNFMLKHTFQSKWWMAATTIALGIFVGLIWPVAIEQSKTQISDWIADTALMLNVSVVLTIEVVIQMCFCMLAAHLMSTGRVKRSIVWTYRVLRSFPGVLIFAVMLHALVQAIFYLPGKSFSFVAWGVALVAVVVFPLGAMLLKYLLPEKDLRLELLFLTNALTAILGIVATVNGRTTVEGLSEIDWWSLAAIAILVVAGVVVGLLIYSKKKVKIKY